MGAWLSSPKAILLDLDNTLYDWVAYFAPALRGMCRALRETTGVSSTTLYDEFKAVFSNHGTVEYSFAMQELPSLQAVHPGETSAELVNRYRRAIDVFQHRRRAFLKPYPGVGSGLALLREAGFRIFGVTDSRRFQAENRLRQLRLDGLIDGLCCVPDHATPDVETVATIRRLPEERYKSRLEVIIPLPAGLKKPSPEVLQFVRESLQLDSEMCIYVGDSLPKDVVMAQQAGVYDCWAEYGVRVSPLDFATLVRVSDWPRAAVQDALDPSPERLHIFPSYTATSFDAVVNLALTEPSERPVRRLFKRMPTQLPLFEIGPALMREPAA